MLCEKCGKKILYKKPYCDHCKQPIVYEDFSKFEYEEVAAPVAVPTTAPVSMPVAAAKSSGSKLLIVMASVLAGLILILSISIPLVIKSRNADEKVLQNQEQSKQEENEEKPQEIAEPVEFIKVSENAKLFVYEGAQEYFQYTYKVELVEIGEAPEEEPSAVEEPQQEEIQEEVEEPIPGEIAEQDIAEPSLPTDLPEPEGEADNKALSGGPAAEIKLTKNDSEETQKPAAPTEPTPVEPQKPEEPELPKIIREGTVEKPGDSKALGNLEINNKYKVTVTDTKNSERTQTVYIEVVEDGGQDKLEIIFEAKEISPYENYKAVLEKCEGNETYVLYDIDSKGDGIKELIIKKEGKYSIYALMDNEVRNIGNVVAEKLSETEDGKLVYTEDGENYRVLIISGEKLATEEISPEEAFKDISAVFKSVDDFNDIEN